MRVRVWILREPLFHFLCLKYFEESSLLHTLAWPQKYKTEERIEVEKASAAARDELLRDLRGERTGFEKKMESLKARYEKEKYQLQALVESEKQKSLESRKAERETIAELHSRINSLTAELDKERTHSTQANHQLESLTQHINVRDMSILLV